MSTALDDKEFIAELRDYLHAQSKTSIRPSVPLFRKDDGTIDREKTLALPCFDNFKKEKSA